MKKSLLAVAAMGAFASVAQAQSSVTVYGILDVGYIGANNRGFNNSGAVRKNTSNSFGSSAESTSRLGFRGTEDLGGGLSAFFTIETQLLPTDGTGALMGGAGQNRQTFVGLAKKGTGNFSIGTQYTTIHTAVGATSAGQQNNIVGDVIYPIGVGANGNVGAGSFGSATAPATVQNAGTSGDSGNTGSYTVRTNNMLKVQSENVAGFVGTAFYTMADVSSTQTAATTGGENNRNGWGAGLNYSFKKLLVSANYQSLKAVNPTPNQAILCGQTSCASVDVQNPAIWSNTAAASNIQDNQMYFGAVYDFGVLKAYAQYINRKATSELDSSNFAQRSAQQIGVRGFVTKTIEGWASAGTGRYDTYGTSAPTVNFTGYQLGSNYWLSKRTNAYAIFGSTQQSSSGVSTQPSSGANQYAVGVRHTF